MSKYNPPIQDFLFLLYDLFQIHRTTPSIFGEYTNDIVEPILNEAGKLASEVILPSNKVGDIEGCKLEAGRVTTPPGFKEAFNMIVAGEWPSLNCDPKFTCDESQLLKRKDTGENETENESENSKFTTHSISSGRGILFEA